MNCFKCTTFAISPLWITHFCKWAIWNSLDVLYGSSFWMSSSYSISCVLHLLYISIWWSQPGQKHKTGQQEKSGHFWIHWLAQHCLSKKQQSDKSWRHQNSYFTISAHGFLLFNIIILNLQFSTKLSHLADLH